jgi:DNA-binding MarR family transcriptional regulator
MAKKDKSDSEIEEISVSSAALVAEVERLARLMRQASHAHGLVPVHWETLRYLAKANRFSNAPGAIARYLGTTKGTISQTVLALEKRGLLRKSQRGRDSRSVSLALTPAAEELLKRDPLNLIVADIDELGGKTTRRFARAISHLLSAETQRNAEPSFGTCLACSHLRIENEEILYCTAFEENLDADETGKICLRHKS